MALLASATGTAAESKRDLVWFFRTVCFETFADREAALAVATGLGFAPGEPMMLPSGKVRPDGSLEIAPTANWRLTENGSSYAVLFDIPLDDLVPEDSCMVSTPGDGAAFVGPVAALAGVRKDVLMSSDNSWIRSDTYMLPHPSKGWPPPALDRAREPDDATLSISTVMVKGKATTAILLSVPKESSEP